MKQYPDSSVVVVDDDRSICELYVTVLSAEGIYTRSYVSPSCGLAELEESTLPDLCFVDSTMAEMAGSEFVKALRKKIPTLSQRTRLVGFSSALPGSVLTCELEPLVDAFYEKPFDLDAFIVLVKKEIVLAPLHRISSSS